MDNIPMIPVLSIDMFSFINVMPIINYLLDGRYDNPLEYETKKGKSTMKFVVHAENAEGVVLNYFDICVFNSLYTLWNNGYLFITYEMLNRVITGSKKADLTDNRQDELYESLCRLSRVKLNITITRAEGKSSEESTYNSRLICIKGHQKACLMNGHIVNDAIEIAGPSALWDIAEDIKQVALVPMGVLEAPVLNNTDDSIILKHYLLHRICVMKNKNNKINSDIIYLYRLNSKTKMYTGLFSVLGYAPETVGNIENVNKRKSIFAVIYRYMDFLKETKYIKDYERIRRGRETVALRIIP